MLPIRLLPREPPLTPSAVVARGAARALAAATLRRLEDGADLHVAGGDGWLLVLGDSHELPWADGCTYLGYDGPLLVPTTRAVSPAPDLVARALGGELVALLDDVVLRGPRPAAPPDRDRLRACA